MSAKAQTVHNLAREIVAVEGGYVNDPDDPGGATKHGITIHTLRALGRDMTGDGRVTAADVRRLTRDDAVEILVRRYFHAPGLDRLPGPLQAPVFDMQVNAGAMAIVLLQRLLNEMGEELATDGVIGPLTEAAAARAAGVAPNHIADAYGIARRNWYYALADRRPSARKYVRRRDGGKGGWITRAERFVRPRYRLSEAEHRDRTAAWG